MRNENDTITREMDLKSYIGYARVSIPDQKLDFQIEALNKVGCF